MSDEKQGLLARKENALLTKEQAIATGGAVLLSGVLDVATQFNSLALFASAAGVFLAYRHGNDILDHFAPGRHGNQAMEATAHFVDAVASHHEEEGNRDQSVPAKLKRMIGLKTPPIGQPKEVKQPQQEVTQVDALGLEPMEDVQPKSRVEPIIDYTADDELAAPSLLPDGPLYFSQVLKTFKPTLDKIYLATLPNGKPVYIKARHLCHTALTGSTRGGKSQIIRQLMSQLCYAGAKVYLLNPHYIRYDLEAVDPYGRPCPEDWTPFEKYLKNDPREMIPLATKYRVIEHYLKVAYELVGKRLEIAGESQQRLGAPHFIVIDELPAIVDEVPGATQYLKRILREGAKVGVFVINASQDLQVSTVFQGIGGGVRACYRTAFDVGSDPATQRALGLPVLNGLGKGNVSLRCDEIASAGRVPFVDNEALYGLLGPSTYTPSRTRHDEEDDLMGYLGGNGHYEDEETRTEELPTQTRRHVATSAYDARRRQLAARRMPVRVQGTPGAQERQSEGMYAKVPDVVEKQEEDEELKRGLVAYKRGATTLDALMAELSITQHAARKLKPRIEKAIREH